MDLLRRMVMLCVFLVMIDASLRALLEQCLARSAL